MDLVEQLQRAIRGKNLAELGRAAKIDKSILSRLARGERLPSLRVAARLVAALGLELAPGRPRVGQRRKKRPKVNQGPSSGL